MSETRRTNKLHKRCLLIAFAGILFVSFSTFAQDFPKEIRGYKVYRAKISVRNQSEQTENSKSAKNGDSEAFVKVGEPELTNVSLTGITFELPAEINSLEQSGEIDFLTFQDFRVNGLAVAVEEYRESFEFKKNQIVVLPSPVKIFVGTGQTLLGAVSEWRNSQAKWTVTGRIFVFGRFKKAGFKFKRVVPVEINLQIENPLPKI